MRILVLGGSGTDGGRLADASKSWPCLLKAQLPPLVGEDVEIVSKGYFVDNAGAMPYLEKVLSEQQPDVLIIAISPFSFAVGTVANRIGRLLGKRAGNISKRTFDAIDDRTLKQKSGPRLWANRRLHWVARTFVGQEGELSERETRGRYIATFDRLAREEAMTVVAMGPVQHMGRLALSQRGMNKKIEEFSNALELESRRRHFAWVDRQALVPTAMSPEALLVDELHGAELTHHLTAGALLVALAPGAAVPEAAENAR